MLRAKGVWVAEICTEAVLDGTIPVTMSRIRSIAPEKKQKNAFKWMDEWMLNIRGVFLAANFTQFAAVWSKV